jgi:hypothetical protein
MELPDCTSDLQYAWNLGGDSHNGVILAGMLRAEFKLSRHVLWEEDQKCAPISSQKF